MMNYIEQQREKAVEFRDELFKDPEEFLTPAQECNDVIAPLSYLARRYWE